MRERDFDDAEFEVVKGPDQPPVHFETQPPITNSERRGRAGLAYAIFFLTGLPIYLAIQFWVLPWLRPVVKSLDAFVFPPPH